MLNDWLDDGTGRQAAARAKDNTNMVFRLEWGGGRACGR
jgi:hypothetical protein